MKTRVLMVLAVLLALTIAAAAADSYKVVNKVVLGGDGGWDYLTFDPDGNRLFISRGTHVMVVDPDGKVTGDIPNTNGVHGIALAPDLGKGFISAGRDNEVVIFDLKTLKETGRAKAGTTPDAIIYDPASKRVFAFNGRSNDATAIDAATGNVAGTIPVGGKPEFAAADGKGMVYVNIEDKSQVLAIDSKDLKVKNTWSISPCDEPSGMAMDQKHRRLFVGCGNKMMAVVNADTGKVVTTVPIGEGVDANGFDPGTELAYSSNGEGTLTVVHEDSPDKYTVVQNVPTEKSARTMALDPKTHKVYLVSAQFGPRPEATKDNPRPRPPMVPGTFTLLVVGK